MVVKSKGIPLFQGKSRLVKYYSIWPDLLYGLSISPHFIIARGPHLVLAAASIPQMTSRFEGEMNAK